MIITNRGLSLKPETGLHASFAIVLLISPGPAQKNMRDIQKNGALGAVVICIFTQIVQGRVNIPHTREVMEGVLLLGAIEEDLEETVEGEDIPLTEVLSGVHIEGEVPSGVEKLHIEEVVNIMI